MTQLTSLCGPFWSPVSPLVGGRPPWLWVGLKLWVLVAALLAPINASAEDLTSPAALEAAKQETLRLAGLIPSDNDTQPGWWPWKTSDELEKPPQPKPYRLPTMLDDGIDYHDKSPAIVQAPALDADAIYKAVLACYPEKSKFDIDVSLRAAVRSNSVLDLEDASTGLGSSYIGIVANMPLYSGRELDREKEREYQRRKDSAKKVADFITAIAERNQAVREFALYRSLEARSSIRVQEGITEANEQVGYLEKVAQSQKELVKAEAKITESRLLLSGMCDPLNAQQIGDWLKQVSAVPK